MNDEPLTDEELTLLSKMDGPPPLEDVVMSRSVHALAIRAVREIKRRRANRTAFELLQELTLRLPIGSPIELELQNIATVRCSGSAWEYVSEGEMAEALELELRYHSSSESSP